MINRQNTEIREQHYMDAEGSEDDKMTKKEVTLFLLELGYRAKFITIGYDNLQSVWRWYCDIAKLK